VAARIVSAREAGFAVLLDSLGCDVGDEIPICHKRPGGVFTPTWTTVADAPETADRLAADSDCWFPPNPVARKGSGRGAVDDVTRFAALYVDLDVKPTGMPTMVAAEAVVADLASLIEAEPTAVIASGHGLQPLWAMDRDDPATWLDDANRGDAKAMLRRFGRLARYVAEKRDGRIDSVFDLARVLRVPGTFNYKGDPVPVTCKIGGPSWG
jgi:hypothetical protein